MSDYPRYFAFGDKYHAPNPYYRLDDETHAVLVIPETPEDRELELGQRLDFFEFGVERKWLTETTRQTIKASRTRWLSQFFPRE